MRGDPDAILSEDSAEAILSRIEDAETADAFITFGATRYAHDDVAVSGYVRASAVAAVLPLHAREYESYLDDPPDWYTQYAPD